MSDSDDDWFNKDEDEMVQNLQEHLKKQEINETQEEFTDFCSRSDNYKQILTSTSCNSAKDSGRYGTSDFAKALNMTPLEMFLYFMAEEKDIFENQITDNDSQKRIILYLRILRILCELELGGFDEQLLSGFAKQTVLLDKVMNFATKLFSPKSKVKQLDADDELILRNIKWLLLRAHKLGVLDKNGYNLITHLKSLLDQCQLPHLLNHSLCLEFHQELKVLPTVTNVKKEIYPKLDDLLGPDTLSSKSNSVPPMAADVADYLNRQRVLLCEDFFQPLHEYVQRLRAKNNVDALIEQNLIWPETELVLNPEYANADRHCLIFLDIRPADHRETTKPTKSCSKLKAAVNYLHQLKMGALLCLTSSFDFDNLILATVGYTEPDILKEGYISVEIARQFNIGNIYGKPLIMFETPAFFEPYLRVHNYLSTCSAENFPMRRYIVDGEVRKLIDLPITSI